MKTTLITSRALLAGAALILTTTLADARDYGVSTSSKGRGTKVETERGGTAYVGPRGVAAEGANGNKAASGVRGAAYSGPNSAGAVNRYGGATAVSNDGDVYRRGGGVAAAPVTRAALPGGYIRTVPAGYRMVPYGGYNCYFVGGIYYRAVMYGGESVYVIVK